MSPNEVQRLLAEQPVSRVQEFATLLGWRGMRLWYVVLPDEEVERARLKSRVIIWYMTTDEKFNLQINQHPLGQSRTYRATVKAERYGIVNVGWHDFELFDDDVKLRGEANRLLPWLQRGQFKDRRLRKQLMASHPEIPLYPTKRRRRRER